MHTPQSPTSGQSGVKNKDRLQVVTALDAEEFRKYLMFMLAMTRRLRNIAIYKEPAKGIRNSLCVSMYLCVVDATYTCVHMHLKARGQFQVLFLRCHHLVFQQVSHSYMALPDTHTMLASDVFWRSNFSPALAQ